MNIFVLDNDPMVAAQLMCDIHTNKMIVESAQMLANCFTPESLVNAPRSQKGNVRKHSYFNHPCSIWARETYNNYQWLVDHAYGLIQERKYRNPDARPHFTEEFITWCDCNIPDNLDSDKDELTPFAIAISDDSKCMHHNNFYTASTVRKYQMYYKYDKKEFAKWTRRDKPSFMV